jgi:hypothetical protein
MNSLGVSEQQPLSATQNTHQDGRMPGVGLINDPSVAGGAASRSRAGSQI